MFRSILDFVKFIYILHSSLRLAYYLAYAKLKFVSYLFWNIKIWPRHSFLTDAFVPMKSDLDLTAYVSDFKSLKSYLKFYNLYKKFFPLIGELNIYTDECIRFIKKNCVNGYELERDPLLIRRFSLDLNSNKYFSREKAISYLLLALINDLHKIKRNPASRIKKWKYHFDHVNSSLSRHKINIKPLALNENSLIFSIITAIVNLTDPSSTKQAELLRSKIRIYLEFLPQANNTPNFIDFISPIIIDENADILCCFIEYLSIAVVALPTISESQFKIMTSQIDWVALRFLKQSYCEKDIKNAISTLENFTKIINQLNQKSEFEVAEILSKISAASEILNKRL